MLIIIFFATAAAKLIVSIICTQLNLATWRHAVENPWSSVWIACC